MARPSLEGVAKTFLSGGREIKAVDGVDLELGEGEVATIVGPSGSGKTTLLRIAAGLEAPDSGRAALRGGGVLGFVFQEPRLLGSLTVEGNVALGLGSRKAERAGAGRVREIIELLGLSDFRRAYPAQLSGGLAQRVALGRALVRDPDLLLMDEPFSALDAPLRRRLQDELLGILATRRTSLAFVTHDLVEALYIGNRVVVLRGGRVTRDEPIALARPRDPRSRAFMASLDSLARALGGGARTRNLGSDREMGLEEDSA
jgi:ABC-type nitrate/sulfonate/bicarbonate transport system ATPase subunit